MCVWGGGRREKEEGRSRKAPRGSDTGMDEREHFVRDAGLGPLRGFGQPAVRSWPSETHGPGRIKIPGALHMSRS